MDLRLRGKPRVQVVRIWVGKIFGEVLLLCSAAGIASFLFGGTFRGSTTDLLVLSVFAWLVGLRMLDRSREKYK